MSDPLLEVRDLRTHFHTDAGVVRAVDGISFDVHEGETVGLVGESGAGKSVAVQSILRLVGNPGRIVSGEVRFRGELIVQVEDVDGKPQRTDAMLDDEAMRRRIRGREIAIIFQDPMESLNPVYTVGGQLREFIEINRDLPPAEAKVLAIETLREVGIPEPGDRYDDYPHQFSGGMRQRVLIAMALACEPSLVIADEPTTALDVTVEAQILDLVEELQDRYGTSFLWVTHDMGVVAEVCDRVNVLYLGEVVEQAEVEALFYDPKHPYTEALLNSIPRPDRTVEALDPIVGVMPEAIDPPSGCRFHPRCPEARKVCTRVHPDPRDVSAAEEAGHRAACLKHESVFSAGYRDSDPIDVTAGTGFAADLAADAPCDDVGPDDDGGESE